jgi:hypothetical protein
MSQILSVITNVGEGARPRRAGSRGAAVVSGRGASAGGAGPVGDRHGRGPGATGGGGGEGAGVGDGGILGGWVTG